MRNTARNLSLDQVQLHGGLALWGAVLLLRSNASPAVCAALIGQKAYDT